MGSMGRVFVRVNIDDAIHQLAVDYDIPIGDMEFTALLITGIQRLPKQPTRKQQLRDLKHLRKADPDDDDLWAQEYALQAKQVRTTLYAATREVTIEKLTNHTGKQPNRRHTAAITGLAALWERHHSRVSLYGGGAGIEFIMAALDALGIVRIMEYETMRIRLSSIRQ